MKFKNNKKDLLMLKSALTEENPFMSTEDVLHWIRERNSAVNVEVEQIKFSEMDQWYVDPHDGNIRHKTGKFFSIEGIEVKTNWGNVHQWDQPIINQPEVGLLGIITKEINGILYFLMQAKIEPGNINNVQIAPTLQATKSNYLKIHKGKTPLYLEYFTGEKKSQVLLDQLQSEQGARFLKKRNRNIIVLIEEEVQVLDNFCWLTLGQIKKLLTYDNVINMDTRTVISGISFGDDLANNSIIKDMASTHSDEQDDFKASLFMSLLGKGKYLYEIEEIISWMTGLKTKYELEVNRIPMNQVNNWITNEYSIYHRDRKYFSVIAVNVDIGNREVPQWTQPLIKAAQEGIVAFLIKKINGVSHFLVQAKLEAGNFDIVEMAPTVQCLTGNYREVDQEYRPPFLDYILNANPGNIRYSTFQSEEGGRFFKEQNKNLLIEVEDNFPIEVPENYIWMTLNQIQMFIKFNNYLNIEARSLISATRYI
jgi:oxidase EvaA